MAHVCYNGYNEYYRGYGLTYRKDGYCTASDDTPELWDKIDYPCIGLGRSLDNGRNYTVAEMKQRIDEVIAEREKRIGWVKEFAKTQKKPDWTERYLLSEWDPNNKMGHCGESHHHQAETTEIVKVDDEYRMPFGMGWVKTSKTKYLYRQFLIGKSYIKKEKYDD